MFIEPRPKKPVIVYAKVGQTVYDRAGNEYDWAKLNVEQFEHGSWKPVDGVVEVDASEGFAIVQTWEPGDSYGYFFGSYGEYKNKRVTGFFRIMPQ